ncbi:unnamed protein product, partial [Sphenostylis stenocarpa]
GYIIDEFVVEHIPKLINLDHHIVFKEKLIKFVFDQDSLATQELNSSSKNKWNQV